MAILEQCARLDSTAYFNRSTLMGRGLRQSRHMRRKSAANYHYHAERLRGLTKPTDEHLPILSQTGLDGFWSYAESNPQHDVSSYQPTSAAEADQTDPINKKS